MPEACLCLGKATRKRRCQRVLWLALSRAANRLLTWHAAARSAAGKTARIIVCRSSGSCIGKWPATGQRVSRRAGERNRFCAASERIGPLAWRRDTHGEAPADDSRLRALCYYIIRFGCKDTCDSLGRCVETLQVLMTESRSFVAEWRCVQSQPRDCRTCSERPRCHSTIALRRRFCN